jgi:hypothetical protein
MVDDASGRQLEAIWRERLRAARLRYDGAAKAFRDTWGEHLETRLTADPSFAILQARKVESAALAEYMRVLEIFTDLVLHGKMPAESKEEPNTEDCGHDATSLSDLRLSRWYSRTNSSA